MQRFHPSTYLTSFPSSLTLCQPITRLFSNLYSKMSRSTPSYEPLPVLHGEETLADWKLKVIQAFSKIGIADYVSAPGDTSIPKPSAAKLAMGITILVPSLIEWRDYLTKAGWKFDFPDQNPKGLYHLAIMSVQQRGNSLAIHNSLRTFLRVEMGEKESASGYTLRVQELRDALEHLGHYVAEYLVVRVTLHGMMHHPDKRGFVKRTVENDLAPGNLTFNKLRKMMMDAEQACKTRAKGKQGKLLKPAASSHSHKTAGTRSIISQRPPSRASDVQARQVHFGGDGSTRDRTDSHCPGMVNVNHQESKAQSTKSHIPRSHSFTQDGARISSKATSNKVHGPNGELNSARPASNEATWSYRHPKSIPMGDVPVMGHTTQDPKQGPSRTPSTIRPTSHSFTTPGYRVHTAANITPAMTEADVARIKAAMSIDRILNPVPDLETERAELEADAKRIKEAMSISRILNPEIKAMSISCMLNPEPSTLPSAPLPACQDTPATRRGYLSMDEMLSDDESRAQPGWSLRVPGAFVDE